MVVTILTTLVGGAIYMRMLSKVKPVRGKELYESYFRPYADRGFSRGYEGFMEETEPILGIKAQGMAAYVNGNYSGAIKFFENYSTKVTKDFQVSFCLGISYMVVDSINKAELQFKKLLRDDKNVYYDLAQWYMALIALNKDDYFKAWYYLSKVKSDRNHLYNNQAEHIIREIEDSAEGLN